MRTIIFLSLVALTSSSSWAGGTRSFRVTSHREFEEGEATGTVITQNGEIARGLHTTRSEVAEAAVFCSAFGPDGTLYLGTGDQGSVYSFAKGKAQLLAKLDAALVAAITVGADGTIYAGTLPNGRVFAIDRAGKSRQLAQLDAEHVWALELDASAKRLYAATGSNGKLFAIDLNGKDKPTVIFESGQKHLQAMVRTDDGNLVVGSGDQGILYRVTPQKSGAATVRVLHDFEGDELRALAKKGSTLYVAVNEFQHSTPTPTVIAPTPKGTKIALPTGPAAPVAAIAPALPPRDRKGKGAVYRIDADGRVEQLHALADGYFTALAVSVDSGGDTLYAASGANGRLYRIGPDRNVVTALDLPERQILTLALSAKDAKEKYLGTGDAAAIYRLDDSPARDATYTTKVFDAQAPSRFGTLRSDASGSLKIETRVGNTGTPDKTWTPWRALDRDKIASGDARYLQARVTLSAASSVLRSLTAYYRPQNQRPRLVEVGFGDRAPKTRAPVVKIRWRAEAGDDDELIYRASFKQEGDPNWRTLGGPDPLSKPEYDWNTETIPDGEYVVRVTASDEHSNPKEEALDHTLVSSPIAIDNRRPEIQDLKPSATTISARAVDTFSVIADAAYSIDGGDFQPAAAKDGIFDELSEEIAIRLTTPLAQGTHSVSLRAVDNAGNVGAIQLSFRVK